MALNVVTLPAEVQERSNKVVSSYENEDCQQLIYRLIKNLQYEQTGRAIMDSIVMTDFAPNKFFELVTSVWDDEDKTVSLFRTKQLLNVSKQISQFRQDGFVGLQEKLMCMGCGGIVIELPEECTMTQVHAWLNPTCPAFLGDEPDKTTGMELIEWPELDHPVVKDRLEKLKTSTFHVYSKEHWDQELRRETWETYADVLSNETTGREKEKLAEAGWYVQLHGRNQEVRCFCCGIEVRHLRKDQCPMMTHLLASPVCPYMHAIMDEEDIQAVFAGHPQEVCKNNSGSPAVDQFFKKIWFQPHIVNYERTIWDRQSTYMQKQSDKEKMRLIAEWLIEQRIRDYSEASPPKKPRLSDERKHLMRRYQWHTRNVDTNTRMIQMPPGIERQYVYTSNWRRKEKYTKKWGTSIGFNRSVPLVEGDWIIMQE